MPAEKASRKRTERDPTAGRVARRRISDVPHPFIKWAGGKRQILAAMATHLPDAGAFGTYHEPFVGGGAVFFHLKPARARLTDSNVRLIRAWKGIKKNVKGVIDELRRHEAMHGRTYYYSLRDKDVDELDDVKLAAWFIYMNRTGYNGLYRVNSRNVFNVPFGDYKDPLICDVENLRACSLVLRKAGAQLDVAPFESVLDHAVAGDFVYFDPPYMPLSGTANFTSYTKDGFTYEDQVRLRDVALELRRRRVRVLLSNADTDKVHELYEQDFEIVKVRAIRSVNSRADRRGPISELLIF